MKCVGTAIVVTVAILIGSTSFADVAWTGTGGDRNWDNPNNWVESDDEGTPIYPTVKRLPTATDQAFINGPGAETNEPLISEGMEAVCNVLVAAAGDPTLEMVGGHLEITGWGAWWGDGYDCHPTFEMSGGTIDFTGSPGILEAGWMDDDPLYPRGSCVGIWVMTGGVVNAKGINLPAKSNNNGMGEFHLDGGQLNVGTARDGLVLWNEIGENDGLFDITEGILVLEGDEREKVAEYALNEWLTAYGGDGFLIYDFNVSNPGMTTVTASLGLPGDLNDDGMVNSGDLDIVRGNWGQSVDPGCLPCGDANGDGVVNSGDLDIVRANWGSTAPASIPEPTAFVLLILGLAGLFVAKRR